jgi:hypothetical protein
VECLYSANSLNALLEKVREFFGPTTIVLEDDDNLIGKIGMVAAMTQLRAANAIRLVSRIKVPPPSRPRVWFRWLKAKISVPF